MRFSQGSDLGFAGLSGRRFPIRRRAWEMDQPEGMVHLEQRFGLSQEKVAPGQQTGIKMLHDTSLRSQVEVDQHVAAENNVELFLKQHLAIVVKVDAVKANVGFQQIAGLEPLVANIFK